MDTNQGEIVAALRKVGASVQSLASLGAGVPDLLVGFRGENFLFEVKDGNRPPSSRRLTDDEKAWHDRWLGNVDVVETPEDAIFLILRDNT